MSNDDRLDGTSVEGAWRGTYRYGGGSAALPAVRFAASIRSTSCGDANLYGEIIDDSLLARTIDGGSQRGMVVHFSRSSRPETPGSAGHAEFAGLISDDGTVMRGTWRLKPSIGQATSRPDLGTWEARRIGPHESPFSSTVFEGDPPVTDSTPSEDR